MDQKNDRQNRRWQILQLLLALIVTTLLAVTLGTLAWLNYSRALVTATSVDMPVLWLRGGKSEDTASIELGNIDVEGNETSKQCVFSVVSTTQTPYILQLAYTTNIPFTYTIYPASLESSAETTTSLSYNGNTYNYGKKLSGKYLDQGQTKSKTYTGSEAIQSNANPQYWQSEQQTVSDENKIGRTSIQYYVLEVSWENRSMINNKETDMLYLSVGTVLD